MSTYLAIPTRCYAKVDSMLTFLLGMFVELKNKIKMKDLIPEAASDVELTPVWGGIIVWASVPRHKPVLRMMEIFMYKCSYLCRSTQTRHTA